MPFESSLPLVAACVLGTVVSLCVWVRVQARGLVVAAVLFALVGIGVFVTDSLVETDREHLLALFPRLARAAERHDLATIMTALDPKLHSLREAAERVLKQVRPTEVSITRIDVTVDPAATPPRAAADLIVRVTGHVIDKTTQGTLLVGLKVLLHRMEGRWLVADAEAEAARPGQGGDSSSEPSPDSRSASVSTGRR